ncbi:MAG TPA: hypothetical protein PK867_17835, partial [Pirellulales bacterium]|nr:hypothetical protein [Pirellulales bacterium]
SRVKMRRDMPAALAEAEEKGEARGQIARIQSFQMLLRQDVTPREQLQTASLFELEILSARLEAELNAKLANPT